MAPALLGVSVAQLSLLINTQIASHMGVGAVSWLTYADRLMEFPTALLGVALGVVLMPQLSAAQGRGDAGAYSGLLDWGLRLVLLLALPCAVALLVFPQPLVAVLFQRGAFSAHDVHQTVHALMGYGVGLMGLVGVKVLAPGFYARQDIRTPVKIAIGRAGADAADEPGLRAVPRPRRAGAVDRPRRADQRRLAAGRAAPRRRLPAGGRLGRLCAARRRRDRAARRLRSAWGAQTIDWVGLHSHQWLRIGWLVLFLCGAALLYFATLRVSGVQLRQFARRG